MQWLLVGAGGFVGAILRYGIDRSLVHRAGSFPLGTLTVNAVGCLLMGLLVGWLEGREAPSPELRLVLGVGLLGALTTFSTFGAETLDLARSGQWGTVGLSVAANLGLALGAVALGRWLVTAAG